MRSTRHLQELMMRRLTEIPLNRRKLPAKRKLYKCRPNLWKMLRRSARASNSIRTSFWIRQQFSC